MDNNKFQEEFSETLMSIFGRTTRYSTISYNQVFLGSLLAGVERILTKEVPTLAVGFRNTSIVLFVNENFWNNELSKDTIETYKHRIGVVVHELLHIAFGHLTNMKFKQNRELYNIACDILVNQYVHNENKKIGTNDFLPDSHIHLGLFPDAFSKNDLNQTSHFYYEKLMQVQEEPEKFPQSFENLQKIIPQLNDEHKMWKDFDKLPESTQEIIKENLKQKIKETKENLSNDNWGKLHQNVRDAVEDIINYESEIDWKKVVSKFITNSNQKYSKSSKMKLSKRYGVPPGRRSKRKTSILVALDTSGSITNDDIFIFFGELSNILRKNKNLSIKVVECDTEIGNVYDFNGYNFPKEVSGGGGTYFDPVFEYYNKNRNKAGFSALIYFTDGYADIPKVKIKDKLLWCLTQKSTDIKNMYKFGGICIKIK